MTCHCRAVASTGSDAWARDTAALVSWPMAYGLWPMALRSFRMKIAICIKQVPDLEALEFDPETKTVKREGVLNLVNTFEKHALSAAKQLVEEAGEGEITVITMGPPQAKDALLELLASGADRAVHLNDRAFAGSDTLATSRALAAALKRGQYDLIFCGKYSLDAETGQVGPEIAELLDIPQVTNARRVELAGEGLLSVTRLTH